MDDAIAIGLVVIAALYVIKRYLGMKKGSCGCSSGAKKEDGSGCGGSCGCSEAPTRPLNSTQANAQVNAQATDSSCCCKDKE